MTRGIRVKNTDDIQKINKIVTRYGFDIWIHGKSGMVDAKSLLGMFLLSLNEPLQIVLEDDVDPTALFKDLKDYLEIDERTNFSRITAFAVQFNIFRNGAVSSTAPFLFSYAIQETKMIFPFPLRVSGCCSYGAPIPADYKTRREELRKEVPLRVSVLFYCNQMVLISTISQFSILISPSRQRSSAETVSIEVRHGIARSTAVRRMCTEPSSG